MLPNLLLCATLASAIGGWSAPPDRADPPVRIWLSDDGHLHPGDRVKVRVQSRSDGYLVVIHVDPDNRVRVLFPLEPRGDAFIRGGQRMEIRGRGGREAFTVDGKTGRGEVYAAVSRDPYQFDRYVVDGHWDLRALDSVLSSDDVEADLNDFVRAAARDGFDYDLVQYGVSPHLAYGVPFYGGAGYPFFGYPAFGYPFYGPYGGTRLFIGLGFGHRFGPRFRSFRRFR